MYTVFVMNWISYTNDHSILFRIQMEINSDGIPYSPRYGVTLVHARQQSCHGMCKIP